MEWCAFSTLATLTVALETLQSELIALHCIALHCIGDPAIKEFILSSPFHLSTVCPLCILCAWSFDPTLGQNHRNIPKWKSPEVPTLKSVTQIFSCVSFASLLCCIVELLSFCHLLVVLVRFLTNSYKKHPDQSDITDIWEETACRKGKGSSLPVISFEMCLIKKSVYL